MNIELNTLYLKYKNKKDKNTINVILHIILNYHKILEASYLDYFDKKIIEIEILPLLGKLGLLSFYNDKENYLIISYKKNDYNDFKNDKYLGEFKGLKCNSNARDPELNKKGLFVYTIVETKTNIPVLIDICHEFNYKIIKFYKKIIKKSVKILIDYGLSLDLRIEDKLNKKEITDEEINDELKKGKGLKNILTNVVVKTGIIKTNEDKSDLSDIKIKNEDEINYKNNVKKGKNLKLALKGITITTGILGTIGIANYIKNNSKNKTNIKPKVTSKTTKSKSTKSKKSTPSLKSVKSLNKSLKL